MSILSRVLLLVSLSLSACAPAVNTAPPPVTRTAQPFAIAANPLVQQIYLGTHADAH
jgi:hypothetical protein